MFGLDKITPGKLVKAAFIGAGACTAAVIAPIGVAAVVGITAATAATSWVADSFNDEANGKNKED